MCAIALGPTPYEQHRDYVLKVLGRRCAWLDHADREAVFHDAYALLLEKQRAGELSLDEMHLQQVRAYLVQTALYKALDEGKRAERKRAVPMGDEALAADDGARGLDEALVEGFDAARVREIVDELPERRRAIVKLRYFMDCAPGEIQALLGLRERVYRRELERAMRQIAERFELVRDGSFCDSRRSMVMAYVSGLSGPERARKAQAHIDSCPGCRVFAVQLRDAARDVAVALPLPLFELRDGFLTRVADGLTAGRDQVTDLVSGAKQQALAATARVDSGTAGMASAVRPGTVAAAVAGCIALGGGATYCAVEGIPAPVRSLISDGPPRERRAEQPRARTTSQAQPATARPAAAVPATAQPAAA
ncbi:sigma-70 family RNA polymerase sigma factor, partial [Conexibacter stalactiti]